MVRLEMAIRLENASGAHHGLSIVSPERLLEHLPKSGDTFGIFYLADPAETLEGLRNHGIVGRRVVGYLPKARIGAMDMLYRSQPKLSSLIIEGHSDTLGDLGRVIRRADVLSRPEVVLPRAYALLGPELGDDLAWLIRAPIGQLTVTDVAQRCGCSARTLRRRFRSRNLPPPNQWMSWMLLCRAVAMLSDRSRSIRSVSVALQMNSSGALSNLCRRLTGRSLSEVRMLGVEGVLNLLEERCAADLGEDESDVA